MAATAEATRLTEVHRLAQSRLGAQVVDQSLAAWHLLDPTALDATTPAWLRVMVPLVQSNRRRSAELAAGYLRSFRAHELGVEVGAFAPLLAGPADVKAVATSLLVTGPVRIKQAMAAGRVLDVAVRDAQASSAAAGMRHALDGGRETVVGTTKADRRALGWARVASGKPCGFCALLAGRGPVYKADTAGFQSHDHCSCGAEPIYHQDAAWPPGSRRYAEIYDDVAKGLPADEARAAFRQAIEGEQLAA